MRQMFHGYSRGDVRWGRFAVSDVWRPGRDGCWYMRRFDISEATIQAVMSEVHDLPPVEDVKAPETLISAEDLQRMLEEHKPQFVPVRGREAEGATPPPDVAAGVVQRRLSNGCTLNYKVSDNDPSSAGMRLCMSGGRAAEVTEGAGPAGVGAMQIGLRTSVPPSPCRCGPPRTSFCFPPHHHRCAAGGHIIASNPVSWPGQRPDSAFMYNQPGSP